MGNMAKIKSDFWQELIDRYTALDLLEAMGMWRDDADRWLFQDDSLSRLGRP